MYLQYVTFWGNKRPGG